MTSGEGGLRRWLACAAIALFSALSVAGKSPVVCDVEAAKELLSSRAVDNVEGIWIYPEDNVTVLVMRAPALSSSAFAAYDITVLESDDCRMSPGEKIGELSATAQANTYQIELFTERKDGRLLKPHSCVATLSKDGDALLLKREKSKMRFRISTNFNRLLPSFWRIVTVGLSGSGTPGGDTKLPVGMMKTYPSYDGNGSSRRQPRWL